VLAVAQLMSPASKPSQSFGSLWVIKERRRRLPEMPSGMKEIEYRYRTMSKAGVIDAPKASPAVTDPNRSCASLMPTSDSMSG
jgi:hypothetical protein